MTRTCPTHRELEPQSLIHKNSPLDISFPWDCKPLLGNSAQLCSPRRMRGQFFQRWPARSAQGRKAPSPHWLFPLPPRSTRKQAGHHTCPQCFLSLSRSIQASSCRCMQLTYDLLPLHISPGGSPSNQSRQPFQLWRCKFQLDKLLEQWSLLHNKNLYCMLPK